MATDSTSDMTNDSKTDSNLRDIADVPAIDVWGETVQARVIVGNNASLAVVELGPNAIVPEHRHEQEQLGLCIKGSITFTIDGERRELGPGGTWRIIIERAARRGGGAGWRHRGRHLLAHPCRLGCPSPVRAAAAALA